MTRPARRPRPALAVLALLVAAAASPALAGRGYITCHAENFGHLEYQGYHSAVFPGHCDPDPDPEYSDAHSAMCVDDGWPAAQFVQFVRARYGPTTHITCFEGDRDGMEAWKADNEGYARRHDKTFVDTNWRPE